jgi:tetratricopeptide (TPR) repeat protein
MLSYLQAARKNPMTGASLQWLGLLAEDEAVSKMLIENGYQRALNKDEQALTFAEYLLLRDDREKAISVMAERIAQKNSLIRKWVPMLRSFSFTPDEIRALLPEAPDAWIIYGEYLQQAGDLAGSEFYRTTALTFTGSAEEYKPHWFQQLIQFYHAAGQPDKALAVLREAAEKVPKHASFHLQLGDYYRTQNISYLAKEEYERTLILDPGNAAARRGLRKMGLLDAY